MAAVPLKLKTDLAPLYEKPDPQKRGHGKTSGRRARRGQALSRAWCQISGDGFDGWIEQNELWGVYPGEKIE